MKPKKPRPMYFVIENGKILSGGFRKQADAVTEAAYYASHGHRVTIEKRYVVLF